VSGRDRGSDVGLDAGAALVSNHDAIEGHRSPRHEFMAGFVRELVMALCYALHNFRVRLTPWQPMV
jgi:hypothetical protein